MHRANRYFSKVLRSFAACLCRAARSGGNRIAMRACHRMTEEAANALVELRTDYVLKFAGLRIGFGIGDGKRVCEEALSEAAATNDIASAALATVSQFNFGIVHCHQAHNREALQGAFGIGIKGMETRELRSFADFRAEPQFLEYVIDACFVFGGVNGNLREAAVRELDTAIRETAD